MQSSSLRMGAEELRAEELRDQGAERLRRGAVMSLGALLVLSVVLLTLGADGSTDGSRVELEAKDGRVKAMQEELAEESSKLDKVKGEFERIKRQQSSLKQREDHLQSKERSIRAKVHQARNSVVSLKYKIHNLEAVRFSNALFSSSASAARKAKAHENLANKAMAVQAKKPNAKKAEGATSGGTDQAKSQIQGVEGLAAAPTVRQTAKVISSLAGFITSRPKAEGQTAAGQLHPAQGVEQSGAQGAGTKGFEKMAVISPKYVVSTTAPQPSVAQPQQAGYRVALSRATAARAQAYERSEEFKEAERKAEIERREMGFLRMPTLPVLKPLGPEASGP